MLRGLRFAQSSHSKPHIGATPVRRTRPTVTRIIYINAWISIRIIQNYNLILAPGMLEKLQCQIPMNSPFSRSARVCGAPIYGTCMYLWAGFNKSDPELFMWYGILCRVPKPMAEECMVAARVAYHFNQSRIKTVRIFISLVYNSDSGCRAWRI